MLTKVIPTVIGALGTVRERLNNFIFFLKKSLPARLKATTRQEASRRDRTDFTKTEKDIGWH